MTRNATIIPLLESLVRDNETFKFPIESISQELTHLFLEAVEFDFFMMTIYKKLNSLYGMVIAHIFVQTMELKLKLNERDIYTLSIEEYQKEVADAISSLENLYITKISKTSSDGELLEAMQ